MKRSLFALLVGLVVLGACSSAPAAQETATPTQPVFASASSFMITDALGRQVTFAKPPTRIVITGKALIMVVDAVFMFPEAAGRIVALGNAGQGTSNFIALIDPNYAAKAILQQDAGAEQIAAAQPDLVILKSVLSETVGKSLEALHIPVIYVDFETPEQYGRDLAILGQIFQNETRAQQLANFYQNKVAEIQNALKDVTNKPRVLMLYYSDKDGTIAFNVPPMDWMQTQIVQMAGGEPVWASASPVGGWTKVTLEQIAAWEPDQVFIISYSNNSSEVVANLKNDLQWKELRAVQLNHLFGFPGDLYSWDQPDTRWILGLSWMAARLHPDSFPQFDIVQQAQQFYQTLYGLDSQFFETKIRPTFKGDLP